MPACSSCVKQRRQDLIVEFYEFGSILSQVRVLSQDYGYWLADVTHPVSSEYRLQVRLQIAGLSG